MALGSRLGLLALVLVAGLLAVPAIASATEYYVDNNGMGTPPCTSAANPCNTIAQGLTGATSGDVVHVGGSPSPYAGNVSLPNGVSLIKDSFASSFDTSGTAVIGTAGDTTPAITASAGTSPRTISGFTLRGGNVGGSAALIVSSSTDNVTIAQNTFDDTSANVFNRLRIIGGSPRVTGNTFIGVNDGGTRLAITYSTGTGGSPEIDHNTIDSFYVAIQINGSASPPTHFNVHDNTMTNLYDDSSAAIAQGLQISFASGQVTRNLLTQIPGQLTGNGMSIGTGPSGTGGTVEVSNNRVLGFASYSSFGGADPVVLSNDVFSNDGAALGFFGTTATATNITATNSTNGVLNYDIFLSSSTLALNSSIVGSKGVAGSGCTSTFSIRTGGGITCGITILADPLFTNPAGDDFSLLAGSPAIDAGDPAAPAPGATDVAGNPRAVAILGCPARRDIGAYESATNPRNCDPPETKIESQPKKKTRKRKARFTFSSSEPGSTFVCNVDGAGYTPCSSPFVKKKLRPGRHRFDVIATSSSGIADQTAATSFWKVIKRKRR